MHWSGNVSLLVGGRNHGHDIALTFTHRLAESVPNVILGSPRMFNLVMSKLSGQLPSTDYYTRPWASSVSASCIRCLSVKLLPKDTAIDFEG